MTSRDQFYSKPCEKIDASCINAFIKAELDPIDPKMLVIKSSWDDSTLNLTPAVHDAETVTHLELSPVNDPHYLDYTNETGEHECIEATEIANMIPMTQLKDVDKTVAPEDGDVYMYDEETLAFEPFALQNKIDDLQTQIDDLSNVVGTLGATVQALNDTVQSVATRLVQINTELATINTSIATINATLTKPANVPADATLVWGNTNAYADHTNTNLKTKGFYSHDPNTDAADDTRSA